MNGSDGIQTNSEANGAYPVPGPDIGQPFDLLITCETQGFKIYVDGQNIGSYPYLHALPDITPQVLVFLTTVWSLFQKDKFSYVLDPIYVCVFAFFCA